MSRQETTQRQRIIINKLSRKPSTFEEIQKALLYQEDITDYRLTCSIRTFQRDLKEIESLYEIEIKYDKGQKVYAITYDGREAHSERLMETFDLYNAIKVDNSFGNHLIFEKRKALGTEHMYGLLHAIKNRKHVLFMYEKFYDASLSERKVRPLAIKEARSRWYLLAADTKDDVIKSFGLDRVTDLEISREGFEPFEDFNPEKQYRHSFGIINGAGEKAEKIVLSFTPFEGRYIKSLPLHHSQEVIEENEEETQFQFYLAPTYDFIQEVLSYGDQVKVLEPAYLVEKIKKRLQNSLDNY